MSKKNVLIIANGEINDVSVIRNVLEKPVVIVAADGGANLCKKFNIYPDYIVGDMDSITEDTKNYFNDCKFIYQPDQYSTDMQKTLLFALSLKPVEIKIIGAFGKRSDHMISILIMLHSYGDKTPIEVYDDFGKITLMDPGTHWIENRIGRTVSFFSFSALSNLSLKGFRYELDHMNYDQSFFGISNIYEKQVCEVSFSSGRLFRYDIRSL